MAFVISVIISVFTFLFVMSVCLFFLFKFLQVNDLIIEYKREDITVWGNKSKSVTDRLYKMVSNQLS